MVRSLVSWTRQAERGFKERPDAAQQFFREGRSGQWPQALTKQQIAETCSVHRSCSGLGIGWRTAVGRYRASRRGRLHTPNEPHP
jgi:hypothetical protein